MSLRPLLIAASELSLIGCEGDNVGPGRGAGTFGTSLNGNILLNDLSSAQATQFCNEVNSANTATLGPTISGGWFDPAPDCDTMQDR